MFSVIRNSVLLYFSCLIMCVNDEDMMADNPQTPAANARLLASAACTLFLASRVMVARICLVALGPDNCDDDHPAVLYASGCVAVIGVLLTLLRLNVDRRQQQEERRQRRVHSQVELGALLHLTSPDSTHDMQALL